MDSTGSDYDPVAVFCKDGDRTEFCKGTVNQLNIYS